MHRIIRILVVADSAEDAKDHARDVLESLMEDGVVDYGHFFNDKVAWARWGKLPVAATLVSRRGAWLLLEGLRADYREFVEHLAKVRDTLATADVEALSNDRRFRSLLRWIGEVEFVYATGEGFGMTIEDVRAWVEGQPDLSACWVVPCDVHT